MGTILNKDTVITETIKSFASKGDKSEKGPKGDEGNVGPKDDVGLKGDVGDKGDKGEDSIIASVNNTYVIKKSGELSVSKIFIDNVEINKTISSMDKTIENIKKNQILMNSNTQNMMNLADKKIIDEMSRNFLLMDRRLQKIETKIKPLGI